MKICIPLLICLFAFFSTVQGGESFDPITLFSSIIVPAMKGFETSKTETFLRGFSFRGDSFPGFKLTHPSEHGMFLRATIHDVGHHKELHDETSVQEETTLRRVTLPQKSSDDDSLEIEFVYGRSAPPDVISAINALIDKLVVRYK